VSVGLASLTIGLVFEKPQEEPLRLDVSAGPIELILANYADTEWEYGRIMGYDWVDWCSRSSPGESWSVS
jgi:hypothetical protein